MKSTYWFRSHTGRTVTFFNEKNFRNALKREFQTRDDYRAVLDQYVCTSHGVLEAWYQDRSETEKD